MKLRDITEKIDIPRFDFYPEWEEIKKADHIQLAMWLMKLPAPGLAGLGVKDTGEHDWKNVKVVNRKKMDLIKKRFKQKGAWSDELKQQLASKYGIKNTSYHEIGW